SNIEEALQNLSGTSIAHIEPNHNQANIEPDLESLNQEPETNTSKKPKTIPGVWKNFQPTQILSHCKRPSPTFSTSSTPKSAWTIPNPELLMNKKISKELSLVNNDELAEMSDTTKGFPLNVSWALKENMKFGNLKAADRYSPEDMHADFEDLARNGEISFKEVLTVKTIKGWIGRYSASFKKEVSERALTEASNDKHAL
ncbi:12550_t:CDS:2, partial [Gigaspora margarita]